jgi:hypothetical protein
MESSETRATYHRTFLDISRRWSQLAGEPYEVMMTMLVQAVLRGELATFFLDMPLVRSFANEGFGPGDLVYGGRAGEKVMRIEPAAVSDEPGGGERVETDELVSYPVPVPAWLDQRRDEDGIATAGCTDWRYSEWPSHVRVYHFDTWRLHRDDFARWYDAAPLARKPNIEAWWPALTHQCSGQEIKSSAPAPAAQFAPKAAPSNTKRQGRPKGSGSYVGDEALVAEGVALLRSGAVTSNLQAAERLATRAQGASHPARVRRLRGKIGRALKSL